MHLIATENGEGLLLGCDCMFLAPCFFQQVTGAGSVYAAAYQTGSGTWEIASSHDEQTDCADTGFGSCHCGVFNPGTSDGKDAPKDDWVSGAFQCRSFR